MVGRKNILFVKSIFHVTQVSGPVTAEKDCLRGCLHDNGATFIPGRDEKLHRVCWGASLIVP